MGCLAAYKTFVPLVFDNGEAFQFDWSEEGMLVGGVFHKVQADRRDGNFNQ
jgi:hypothetical protein